MRPVDNIELQRKLRRGCLSRPSPTLAMEDLQPVTEPVHYQAEVVSPDWEVVTADVLHWELWADRCNWWFWWLARSCLIAWYAWLALRLNISWQVRPVNGTVYSQSHGCCALMSGMECCKCFLSQHLWWYHPVTHVYHPVVDTELLPDPPEWLYFCR